MENESNTNGTWRVPHVWRMPHLRGQLVAAYYRWSLVARFYAKFPRVQSSSYCCNLYFRQYSHLQCLLFTYDSLFAYYVLFSSWSLKLLLCWSPYAKQQSINTFILFTTLFLEKHKNKYIKYPYFLTRQMHSKNFRFKYHLQSYHAYQ